MEFLASEILELLSYIGLAGTWSYNKPSPFSPFKKEPRAVGDETFTPDDTDFKYGQSAVNRGPYSQTETVLGENITTPQGQGTGIATRNIASGLGSVIDTSNIDFGNVDQVKEIQRAIGVEDDGIWGHNTESAYQQYINERRTAQGLGQYMYDDLPISENNNNIGTLSDGKPIVGEGKITDVLNQDISGSHEESGYTPDNPPPGMQWDPITKTFVAAGVGSGESVLQGDIDPNTGEPINKENENKYWGPDKLWNIFGWE
jgi:hypothetical protein